jgi:hypothetical protein
MRCLPVAGVMGGVGAVDRDDGRRSGDGRRSADASRRAAKELTRSFERSSQQSAISI